MWRLLILAGVIVTCLAWLGSAILERPGDADLEGIPLDHARPKPQGGVYRCPVEYPRTLNPFTTTDTVARKSVLAYTHDALADLDPATGDLRPALAVTLPIETDEDGHPVFDCTLREGLTFSDGTPVTLADVEFTATTASTLARGEVGELTSGITRFEAIGDRRFRVHTASYSFAFGYRFATRFRIVKRDWFVDQVAALASKRGVPPPAIDTEEFAELLRAVHLPGPGTGPYRIHGDQMRWPLADSLTLTQNPHCWRRDAQPDCWNLAAIRLLFGTDRNSLPAALNQEIDYLTGIPHLASLLEDHPRLRDHYVLHTYDKLTPQLGLIAWSCHRPPFDDPDVRRALTMLFDRATICARILGGRATVATSYFPPGSSATAPELSPPPFDPSAARDLLERAGASGLEVEIGCDPGALPLVQILELAAEDFRAAGATLRIRSEPWEQLDTRLQNGDFTGGIIYLLLHPEVIDPRATLHSSVSLCRYEDPAFDALLERASQERDLGIRRELLRDVTRHMHETQPVTLLFFTRGQALLHKRFESVVVGPLGLYPERWWVR